MRTVKTFALVGMLSLLALCFVFAAHSSSPPGHEFFPVVSREYVQNVVNVDLKSPINTLFQSDLKSDQSHKLNHFVAFNNFTYLACLADYNVSSNGGIGASTVPARALKLFM